MNDRLDAVEAAVAGLSATVARLEARVASFEGGSVQAEVRPPADMVDEDPGMSALLPSAGRKISGLASLLGRCSLVICGAFLLRAVTDAGTIPQGVGVFLGFAYAVAWMVLAYRAAAIPLRLSAEFHGVMSVLVGYPLLWEATARFGLMSPAVASSILVAFAVGGLWVAGRQGLRTMAWAVSVGAVATAMVLGRATHHLELFTAILVLLGVVTLWVGYSRSWPGLRWLPAAAAALAISLQNMVATTLEDGPREAYGTISPSIALVASVVFVLAYVASFAIRTLVTKQSVGAFEIIQTTVVVFVGLGGAARCVGGAGVGALTVGLITIAVGIGSYAVAFVFVDRGQDSGRNFYFYTSLGLLLSLYGWVIAVDGGMVAIAWCVCGVTCAALGGRYDRVTLRAHAAVYLLAATLVSGLGAAGLDALIGSVDEPWDPLSAAAVTTLLAAVLGYTILALLQLGRESSWPVRIPRFVVAVISCFGIAAASVSIAGSIVPTVVADAGALAALRSCVIAVASLLLASIGRNASLRELGWLVFPLLGLGGLKLLVEDLPNGRPATLFPAFALYGLALILAPRILRNQSTTEADEAVGADEAHVEV